jgi:uncharacterized protein (DUF4415 family)
MSDTKLTRAVLTSDGQILIAQPDGSYRPAEDESDWERVRSMSEEEIEANAAADPDTLPAAFWDTAQPIHPSPKERITVRLDADLVAWFRRQGKGYQTRINAVLRSYYERARRHRGA